MSKTTLSSDTQLPAIAGVEDIARLEQKQLQRVETARRESALKEEETNLTFEKEREAAIAEKRKEAETELIAFKEEELSHIIEQSQTSSLQECERVAAAGAKKIPALASSLIGQLTDGHFLS